MVTYCSLKIMRRLGILKNQTSQSDDYLFLYTLPFNVLSMFSMLSCHSDNVCVIVLFFILFIVVYSFNYYHS